jgi:hypothetical protein
MPAVAIARKELQRRRFPTLLGFCLVSLVLLGLASLIPRSWTANAVLEVRATGSDFESVATRLREELDAGTSRPGQRVQSALSGREITVRFTAGSAEEALAQLGSLLERLIEQELGRLRAAMRATEATVAAELEQSGSRLREAEAALDRGLGGLPEGGESALGARIGQLQGEREALDLDLRTSGELQRTLTARVRELDAAIGALAGALDAPIALLADLERRRGELRALRAVPGSDIARAEQLELEISRLDVELAALQEKRAAAQARIDTELQPQRHQATARLATLAEEIALKQRRREEIDRLIVAAREEAARLLQENQQLRELQRAYDDAAALNRQLKLRLQAVRDEIAVKANVTALPFEVARQPVEPSRPDGVPAWLIVLASLVIGLVVAAARLLGTVLVDDRVRLAETLIVEAEIPVLAVIPDYRPLQAVGQVRWQAILAALLVMATAAAMLQFLRAFG